MKILINDPIKQSDIDDALNMYKLEQYALDTAAALTAHLNNTPAHEVISCRACRGGRGILRHYVGLIDPAAVAQD